MIKLEHNEKVIRKVRKHWFVFVAPLIFTVIAAFAPPLLYFLVGPLLPFEFVLEGQMLFIALFFYTLWLLAAWAAIFVEWTDYYLDVWYVTTLRVIDVEQKGIFNREISSLRLDKIQDITTEIRGIIRTVFNFGDVHVQTAGQNREILIPNAANPNGVKHLIFEEHNGYEKRRFSEEKAALAPSPETS